MSKSQKPFSFIRTKGMKIDNTRSIIINRCQNSAIKLLLIFIWYFGISDYQMRIHMIEIVYIIWDSTKHIFWIFYLAWSNDWPCECFHEFHIHIDLIDFLLNEYILLCKIIIRTGIYKGDIRFCYWFGTISWYMHCGISSCMSCKPCWAVVFDCWRYRNKWRTHPILN